MIKISRSATEDQKCFIYSKNWQAALDQKNWIMWLWLLFTDMNVSKFGFIAKWLVASWIIYLVYSLEIAELHQVYDITFLFYLPVFLI